MIFDGDDDEDDDDDDDDDDGDDGFSLQQQAVRHDFKLHTWG